MKNHHHKRLASDISIHLEWSCFNAFDQLPVNDGRPEMEIQYIRKGEGVYSIAGRNYPFRRHAVLIIPPSVSHGHLPRSDAFEIHCSISKMSYPVEKAILVFPLALLRHSPPSVFVRQLYPCITLQEGEAMEFEVVLHTLGDELSRRKAYWCDLAISELKKILILLKRAIDRTEPAPACPPKIDIVRSYIEQHFAEDLTRQTLAWKFAISVSRLSHLFREHTGLGIKQYILQRRILEAKRVLETDLEIKMVALAEQVGFQDFGLFNRSFKHITGITPAAYGRSCRV